MSRINAIINAIQSGKLTKLDNKVNHIADININGQDTKIYNVSVRAERDNLVRIDGGIVIAVTNGQKREATQPERITAEIQILDRVIAGEYEQWCETHQTEGCFDRGDGHQTLNLPCGRVTIISGGLTDYERQSIHAYDFGDFDAIPDLEQIAMDAIK